MNTYLKYKPVWYRIMVMISLIAGAYLIFAFFSLFLIRKMTGATIPELQSLDFTSPEMVSVQKILLLVQSLVLIIIPSLLYAYFADPHPTRFLRLDVKPRAWHLLVAAVIVLIAMPSAFWLGELNKQMDLSRSLPALDKWVRESETETNKLVEAIIGKQDLKNLLINMVLMALLPAIGEEILFRGLIQKGLIRVFRKVWPGILVSAFIFSFIHFQFLTFLTRFELGIILGALFWYSGSLWVPVLAHFVFNGIQVYAAYLQPEMKDAPDWSISAGLVGGSFLVVLVLVIILRQTSTVNMYEVYDDEDDFGFEVGPKDEYLD
ncbi:MAG: CPBP family intramembrane metalloprotease [Chitinophagaceae bacterium]|nr:CPBP family intramembrane metalloprotease [Chitinophagaceae bacterium]